MINLHKMKEFSLITSARVDFYESLKKVVDMCRGKINIMQGHTHHMGTLSYPCKKLIVPKTPFDYEKLIYDVLNLRIFSFLNH